MTSVPSASTSSNWSTAQSTVIDTTDHWYTRARFTHFAPPHSHVQHNIHITQQWPSAVDSIPTSHMPTSSASPDVSSPYPQPCQQVEDGAGPSSLPDNEQSSSPMTSSPVASNPMEFAPQPTSFEQRSVETHSGKKRHKCNVCGSYWGRPSSLKIHMVSHTGVKGASWSIFPVCSQPYVNCPEFVCSVCKQDFGVKSNYTRHIRVHHKDSSEGTQTRAAGRRRRGSRRNQDVGPVRFVDEGPKFQGQ